MLVVRVLIIVVRNRRSPYLQQVDKVAQICHSAPADLHIHDHVLPLGHGDRVDQAW